MKLKLLPIIIASMALVACGSKDPTPSQEPIPAPSVQPIKWVNLDFLSGENNARFDVFNFEEGLQVSYGNAALVEGTNSLKLNDSSLFSVNKNLEHEKSFNALIVAETHKNGYNQAYQHVYLATEGDHITDLFDIIKNVIVGYERAYIAFSVGEAKWTKGLNSNLDEFFTTATTPATEA